MFRMSGASIETRSEYRGVGYAALLLGLQILLTAAWAVGRLWFAALLGDRVIPNQSWIASVPAIWSAIVGLMTALASLAVVYGSRRMLGAAMLWAVTIILLVTMNTMAFGFHWSSIPILASAAALVFAVHHHWSRAA